MRRVLLAMLALAPFDAWAQNPLDALRLDDLTVTRDRPLFAPTRRPPIPVGVEAPAPPPPVEAKAAIADTSPFELLGSAIGRETAFALLRNKETGKVVRVRRGEDEEGWRIGSITQRAVTLERDGRTQSLALSPKTPIDAGALLTGEANGAAPPSLADAKRAGELLNK